MRASISGLAARLHSLDTPVDSLPVTGYQPESGPWRPRAAAVLVPVLLEPEPVVILTVRSRKLAHHAGQVSFPGGGRQGNESFPFDTALRETHEETGIESDKVELIGLLDRFDTITGYRVTPVVAAIHGRPCLAPCPDEVREIFSLPWSTVADPARYRRHRVIHGHRRYQLTSMGHPRWLIWGATAAILQQLCLKAGQGASE